MDKLKHIKSFNEATENLESGVNEEKITQIKDEYIEINKQYNELNKKLNQLSKSIREILDNETDVNKRKEIIDFVYAGKVEEVHEHALRKMYLK